MKLQLAKPVLRAVLGCGLMLAPLSVAAQAATIPSASRADQRVKTVVYNDSDVVSLRGHYGYQTTISFATYEKIQNISIGDSVSWQVVPNKAGNILFIKPIEENATTNMTVITDRRIYNFELSSGRAYSSTDANLTYMLKFIYPDDTVYSFEYDDAAAPAAAPAPGPYAQQPRSSVDKVAISASGTPTDLNFDYTYKGEKEIAPSTVFDNGEFTYFKFRDMADLPAVFEVDRDRNESVVNFHVEDGYMIVESVGRQFTLRHGDDEACVFNEAFANRTSLFTQNAAN